MSSIRRNAGFTLVGVLVSSALLAIVSVGFSKFLGSAMKAQGNLQKTGEASSLDMAVRTLLGNSLACRNTVNGIPNRADTTNDQPTPIRDASNAVVFQQGMNSNGITIETLTARAFPINNGVQLIRFNTTYTKVGDAGARKSYSHQDFVNISLDTSNNVVRCLGGQQQDEFRLIDVQNVVLQISPSFGNVVMFTAGTTPFINPLWLMVPMTPIACNLGTGTCPSHLGEPFNVRALGNRMDLAFQGGMSTAPVNPAGTIGAYAAVGQIEIDSPGLPQVKILLGSLVGASSPNFFGVASSQTSMPTLLTVEADRVYTLRLRLTYFADPAPGVPIHGSVALTNAEGQIRHYFDATP